MAHTRLEFELTEDTCVADKDVMLQLLDVECDDTFHSNAAGVLDVLETSAHLFDRLGYSYKASEIATRIGDRCDTMRQLVAVTRLRDRACRMVRQYRGLEMNRYNR